MAGLPTARVVVDVVGAVRRPGLYRLAQGSRIADAVARAGGATGKAELSMVNLAAPLADGEQVVVPKRARPERPQPGAAGGAEAAPAEHRARAPQHRDARAARLAAGRRAGDGAEDPRLPQRSTARSAPSTSSMRYPGIGPSRMDQLRDLVAP